MPAPTTTATLNCKRHPSDNTVIILEIPGVAFTTSTKRSVYERSSNLRATRKEFASRHAEGLIDDIATMIDLCSMRSVKRICMEADRLEVHTTGTGGQQKIARNARDVLAKLFEGPLNFNYGALA